MNTIRVQPYEVRAAAFREHDPRSFGWRRCSSRRIENEDARLRMAYEADKQRILACRVTDSLDYCKAKSDFITSTLTAIVKS